MQKHTYNSVLKDITSNLDDTYIQHGVLKLDLNECEYLFDPDKHTVGCYNKTNDLLFIELGFFFALNNYYYFETELLYNVVPSTADEWFNFSLTHAYTEEDFLLFKKLHEYYIKYKSYPYEK